MTLYSRLAAYYPCDDTHGRSLSEDIVGTNNGTAGVASSATGKVRQGMFFLSSGSQFRSVPDDSAIKQLKGVCCWVKFTTLAADMSLVSKGSDGTDANTSIKLWYDHSDTDLALTVGDGSTSTTINTDGLTLAIDTWYHIRAYNDGNRMGIAVNGTLYASGTARAPLTEAGLLYLGRDFGGNYLDGVLDEVALFSTAPTIADGAALYNGGSGASLPIPDTLPGPLGRAGVGSRWLPPSFAESDDAVSYMAHGKLPVQRFDGTLSEAGVEAPATATTIASSGAGRITGSFYAYSRFLDASGRVSSVSPISDVHVATGSGGATITGATNASPIVITSLSHGLSTGQDVTITGQVGNVAANGRWTVTSLTDDTFSLGGSVGSGDWAGSEESDLKITTRRNGQASVNEVQSLAFSGTPSGGTFTVTSGDVTSGSISATASASAVQAALEGVTSIGEGNVTCSGGPMGTTAVTATFVGSLAGTNVDLMTGDATNTLGETIAIDIYPSDQHQDGNPGTNERQTIDLLNGPTGGTFTLTFDGQTTGSIAYNASASAVDSALEALSNIASSDLTTTGGPLPGTAVTVDFGGTHANQDVELITGNAPRENEWQYLYLRSAGSTGSETQTTFSLTGDASVSAGTFTITGQVEYGFSTWTTSAIAFNANSFEILQAIWAAESSIPAHGSGEEHYALASALTDSGTVPSWGRFLSGGQQLDFTMSSDTGQQTNLSSISIDSSGLTGGTYTVSDFTNGSGGTFTITGTYKLSYSAENTAALDFSASAATIQSALESLSSIGTGNISVSGGPLATGGIALEFKGNLAGTDVGILSLTDVTPSNVTHSSFSSATLRPGGGETLEHSGLSMSVSTTVQGTDGLGSAIAMYVKFDESSYDALEMNAGWASSLTNGGNFIATQGGWVPGDPRRVSVIAGGLGNAVRLGVGNMGYAELRMVNYAQSLHYSRNDITIAGWVRFPSTTVFEGTTYAMIPEKPMLIGSLKDSQLPWQNAPIGSAYNWRVGLYTQSDVNEFVFNASGDELRATSFGEVTHSTWYFVCVRRTAATKLIEISVNDGVVDSTTGIYSGSLGLESKLYMAAGEGGGERLMDLDEWGKWNRRLTDAEVTTLYNSGSGQTYPFSDGTAETQQITTTGSPTEGTFSLTYSGQTTADIPYNASNAAILSALEELSNIELDYLTCTGGPLPATPVSVQFSSGLGNVDQIAVDDAGLFFDISTTILGSPSQNEIQSITAASTPDTGTFTLTFDGQTTSALGWNATASEVDTALEALSNIGAGNVTCSGGPLNTTSIIVEFTGTLAAANQDEMTATSSLTGTVPTLTISDVTKGTGPVNEIQDISVSGADAGSFSITYSGQTTTAISFGAAATEVEDALNALSNITSGDVEVSGGPLTETRLSVEFKGTLASTNVAQMTVGSDALRNGGWSQGASKITYSNVPLPSSTNVTRRQILRSKPGAAGVFYIDVDEEDVVSTEFSSTNTDDDLTRDLAVVMLDANGVDSNLSRHGIPPDYKRVVASYQNRMFYGVSYVERSMVTVSGDTATGVGTDWPNVFDDRTLYEDSGKALASINADTQTAALTESTTADQTAASATITQAAPDEQRIYHSWVTSEDSFAESVHPNQTFQVSRNSRDSEMTSEFVFDGKFYVGFKAAIYQYTFNQDPTSFPDGDGRMQLIIPRGVINNRCVAYTDDLTVIMDREGVFMFDGNTLDPVSGPIKPVFTGIGSPSIQWKNQEWFHAAYFSTQRTVRFFVTLDGGPYPRHALCFNVDQRFWWVEEYPWPITSSTVGVVDGQSVVFLGSVGRTIFTLSGEREGLSPSVTGTLRGTVTSSGSRTLTDSTAAFNAELVGSVLKIVEGTGRGQQRIITKVTSTSLTVKQHWSTRPSTDSVYQVSGVSWSFRTGKLLFSNNNQREVRRLELFWEPTSSSSHMDYQLYPDWSATAYVNKETRKVGSTDGVVTTKGSPHNKIDLTERGHVEQEFGGNRPEGVSGEKFISVSAEGVTNDEQLRLLGLAVAGSE